jgi:hypothetical protein
MSRLSASSSAMSSRRRRWLSNQGPLARYHAPLLAAARFAGNTLICGGADPGRRNITNPLISALDGGTGLPRLDTSRLRATWLRDCADLLGLAAFMTAAGVSCSQRPGGLIAGLEPAERAWLL